MNNSTIKIEARNSLQLQISFLTALSLVTSADEFEEWSAEIKSCILGLLSFLAIEVQRLSRIVFG